MNKEFWKAISIAYIITFLFSLLFNIWLLKESFEFALFLRAVFEVLCIGIEFFLTLALIVVVLAFILLALLVLRDFLTEVAKILQRKCRSNIPK